MMERGSIKDEGSANGVETEVQAWVRFDFNLVWPNVIYITYVMAEVSPVLILI